MSLRHFSLALVLACGTVAVGCESGSNSDRSGRAGTGRNNPDGTYTAGYDRSSASARTASERMGMGKVSPADKAFLVTAAGSNRAEIAAAELALRKSNDPQVKKFAQQILTEHRQADTRLMALARSKGVDLDAEIPQPARSASYELGKLDGSTFDRQYFAVNHASHMKSVAAFQHAAQNADDPDIRRFAAEMLPTLQQHTQQAGTHAGHSTGNMGGMNPAGSMNNMRPDNTIRSDGQLGR